MVKKVPPKSTPKKNAPWLTFRRALGIVGLVGVVLIAVSILTSGKMPFSSSKAPQNIKNPEAPLATFYAPGVLYWRNQIQHWAQEYDLNPNVIAIIMQMESCGDPLAISGAGAIGIMQVMPFNFQNGDNMLDPDTNVRRGMAHLESCLAFAEWDMGGALACYNGGFVAPSQWVNETQRYYYWGTGLWQDVMNGSETSATLEEWLTYGQPLCTNALQNQTSP